MFVTLTLFLLGVQEEHGKTLFPLHFFVHKYSFK